MNYLMSYLQYDIISIISKIQLLHTVHYSFLVKPRPVQKLGGNCVAQYTTSVRNPSLCVPYSVFMQSGVLWEEPELAMDSKRSQSSGNGDPVDAVCSIIFISFGQERVPTRQRKQTKTT